MLIITSPPASLELGVNDNLSCINVNNDDIKKINE